MTAPWNSGLPTTLKVEGEDRPIRTDFRAALDCFLALTDTDLDDYNKALEVLEIIYIDPIKPTAEALEQALWFLRGGENEPKKKGAQLVSWTQDYNFIASAISKIIGTDIRGLEYLHWWSFLSAYMSIGDCLFAQIVAIRDKKARGKALDKVEKEFYRRNKELVDIQRPLSDIESEIVKEWMG